jgi:hypothetical protein
MTENNHQRHMLIATKYDSFSAHAKTFRAQENYHGSRKTPPPHPQLFHRVFHTVHIPPVDITVDKEPPPTNEKAQQIQHFKYHRPARHSYCHENKSLTALWKPQAAPSRRATPIVTPIWNMHRSRAACSLNVTTIGICLSSQHYVVTAISHFSPQHAPRPLTHPHCGTIVKSTFGILAAHEPGVFPGTS